MKQLILVEDCPWKAERGLKELKEKGIVIAKVFFFCRKTGWDEENKILIKNFEEAIGIKVELIRNIDFFSKLDQYYDKEHLFLFDLSLEDGVDDFEKRVNVQFAKSKQKDNTSKIYFYTNAGKEQKALLYSYFPNQVIDVERYEENQLIWNIDEIVKLVSDK